MPFFAVSICILNSVTFPFHLLTSRGHEKTLLSKYTITILFDCRWLVLVAFCSNTIVMGCFSLAFFIYFCHVDTAHNAADQQSE